MKKYLLVVQATWNEILTYRLNFTMWRVRTVLQLLTVYFLWEAVMPQTGQLFGYSKELMLTYILGTQVVSSIVFSTRTSEIAENINNGDLSIFLLKPIGYFRYWFTRDLGDKAMNVLFSSVEIGLIFIIFNPQSFLQTDPSILLFTVISLILAIILHFFLSTILSLTGFWSPEVWAPRFIFYILLTFFTGGMFPLDILPSKVYFIFKLLPFSYLQFFPIKLYLGQLTTFEIFSGFFICSSWIFISYFVLRFIYNHGIKSYTAVGR